MRCSPSSPSFPTRHPSWHVLIILASVLAFPMLSSIAFGDDSIPYPHPQFNFPRIVAPDVAQRRPFVIVMTGYGTCEQDLNDYFVQRAWWPMNDFRDQIVGLFGRDPNDTDWLISCFGQSGSGVRYFLSGQEERPGLVHTEQLIRIIHDRVRRMPGRAVYIVGHSFGGWLASKLALTIAADVPVISLATIDPISPVTCSPSRFAEIFLGSIFGRLNPIPGCIQSPADLLTLSGQRRHLIGSWINVYQAQGTLLRSGPVVGADQNIHLAYRGYDNSKVGSHGVISKDPGVWQRIYAATRAGIMAQINR